LAALLLPHALSLRLWPMPKRLPGPLKFESHPTNTTYRTLMQGSGFWVDDTGDLVTARHVVEGCSQVVISGQGLSQTARSGWQTTPMRPCA
jgi:S1-C subfamily serine protease